MDWIDKLNEELENNRREKDENSVSAKSAAAKVGYQVFLNNPEAFARQRAHLQSMLQDSAMQSSKGTRGGNSLVRSGKAFINLAKAKEVAHAADMCPHCGREGTRVNMKAHHYDKCKQKPEVIMEALHRVPTTFMHSQMKEVLDDMGLGPQWQRFRNNHKWFDPISKWGSYTLYTAGENYYKFLDTYPKGENACDVVNGLELFLQQKKETAAKTWKDKQEKHKKQLYDLLPDEFTRAEAEKIRKENGITSNIVVEMTKDTDLFDSYRHKKTTLAEGCPPKIYKKKY